MTRQRLLAASATALLALGLWQVAVGLWIPAKAALAQLLLHAAWARATPGVDAARPWPWAEFRALAELEVGQDRYIVVSDAAGESLAFAPSHVTGSAEPGNPGTVVIAAHRDTHFAGLNGVQSGDRLALSGTDGRRHGYIVREVGVLDDTSLSLPDDGIDRLVLVTCWPFRSLDPNPAQRYVVVAEATTQ